MWVPDFTLKPSRYFVLLLVALHLSAAVALWMLPPLFLVLLPLLVVSMLLTVAKQGLLLLNRSVVRVWLGPRGWHVQYKNNEEEGPFILSGQSRLDSRFIRLSLVKNHGHPRHVLITPAMTGQDTFRQLQVFLRWAPDKDQAPLIR